MSLTRRTFLKLSAAGAAAATLPFGGAGCATDEAPVRDVSLEGDDTLVYFAGDVSFLVDPRRHRVSVRNAVGAELAVLGGFGLSGAKLNFPTDLAVSNDGTLIFVADRGNHRIQTYRRDGSYVGQIGAGYGTDAGQLAYPAGVAVDGEHVIVADSGNHRIQRFTFDGRSVAVFGDASLSCPVSVTVTDDGRVHVASAGNGAMHVYDHTGALRGTYGTNELFQPRAVVAGRAGEVFVGDGSQGGVFVYDADGTFVERLAHEGNRGVMQLSLSPDGFLRAAANLG